MLEIIEKVWTLPYIGKILIISAPILLGLLIWRMMVESLGKLANALSRIADALNSIVDKLVVLVVALTIVTIIVYGAFFSGGVRGVKATQQGKSISVQVDDGR